MCRVAMNLLPAIHLSARFMSDATVPSSFEFLRRSPLSSWRHRASIHRRVMFWTKTNILSIPQAAAIDSVVTTNPMGNATAVRRGLELHPDPMVKVSPSKQRMVQRAVARARAKALLPFTMGEEMKGDEGSLNRFSEQIFLKDLVDDHNSGQSTWSFTNRYVWVINSAMALFMATI